MIIFSQGCIYYMTLPPGTEGPKVLNLVLCLDSQIAVAKAHLL